MTLETETFSMSAIIRSRRSIRHFRDDPIPHETIKQLIDDARWSPSPHNSQPWRFTIIGQASKKSLAEAMALRLQAELQVRQVPQTEIERQTEWSVTRICSAPAAVLVSIVPDGLVLMGEVHHDHLEMQMAIQSVGAVAQNIFLLASLQGIGTCWLAAPMYCPEVVRQVLYLSSDHHPQALILMGVPTGPRRERPRRPLDELVTER